MNSKKLTWKQYIVTKPSIYLNLQDYIKNGNELLNETDFDQLDQGERVKKHISKFVKEATELLRKGDVR